jgi:hypothetical protein
MIDGATSPQGAVVSLSLSYCLLDDLDLLQALHVERLVVSECGLLPEVVPEPESRAKSAFQNLVRPMWWEREEDTVVRRFPSLRFHARQPQTPKLGF